MSSPMKKPRTPSRQDGSGTPRRQRNVSSTPTGTPAKGTPNKNGTPNKQGMYVIYLQKINISIITENLPHFIKREIVINSILFSPVFVRVFNSEKTIFFSLFWHPRFAAFNEFFFLYQSICRFILLRNDQIFKTIARLVFQLTKIHNQQYLKNRSTNFR